MVTKRCIAVTIFFLCSQVYRPRERPHFLPKMVEMQYL